MELDVVLFNFARRSVSWIIHYEAFAASEGLRILANKVTFKITTAPQFQLLCLRLSLQVPFILHFFQSQARLVPNFLNYQHEINPLYHSSLPRSFLNFNFNLNLNPHDLHQISSTARLSKPRRTRQCAPPVHDQEARRRNYIIRGLLFVKVSSTFNTYHFHVVSYGKRLSRG